MDTLCNDYSPLDPCVTIHGRTVLAQPLPLLWTGSGVEFALRGGSLAFDFETDFETREQWVRLELDGADILRTPLPRGRRRLWVLRGMDPGVVHRVRLYKETQPMPRDPSAVTLLHRILCDGALLPVPPRPHRIEFVGDSVTAGEGLAGGPGILDGGSLVFSTRGHYAVEAARQLNADFRILAQSGWGVASGWDNDPRHALPAYYEQICGVVGGVYRALGAHGPQEFSSWVPDVVVAHLGYNDGFALGCPVWVDPDTGTHYPPSRAFDDRGALFCQAACAHLQTLRRCNPGAHLVWAYGMFGQRMDPWVRQAIGMYRRASGDRRVTYLPLPDTAPEDLGSNAHPGPAAHRTAAALLVKTLAPLLREHAPDRG